MRTTDALKADNFSANAKGAKCETLQAHFTKQMSNTIFPGARHILPMLATLELFLDADLWSEKNLGNDMCPTYLL